MSYDGNDPWCNESWTGPTPDQRRTRLQFVAASWIANGARIEATGQGTDGYAAVLVQGKPVNHVLHVLLSFLTCGLWLFVWPVVAILGGEKRYWLEVDPSGNVIRRKL